MDGNKPMVNPDCDLGAAKRLVFMPVDGIIKCLLDTRNDDRWVDADIRLTTPLRSSPLPNLAEHATVQVHQESMGEDTLGTNQTGQSLSRRESIDYVVGFSSVEVSSCRDEVRNETPNLIVLKRCCSERF